MLMLTLTLTLTLTLMLMLILLIPIIDYLSILCEILWLQLAFGVKEYQFNTLVYTILLVISHEI